MVEDPRSLRVPEGEGARLRILNGLSGDRLEAVAVVSEICILRMLTNESCGH